MTALSENADLSEKNAEGGYVLKRYSSIPRAAIFESKVCRESRASLRLRMGRRCGLATPLARLQSSLVPGLRRFPFVGREGRSKGAHQRPRSPLHRPRFGDSESAFVLQPVLDLVDPLFTGPQRRGAGMHRVLSEHEVMGVRSPRPKNELRIGLRIEVDRVIRRLEDRKFAGFHTLRDRMRPVLGATQPTVWSMAGW